MCMYATFCFLVKVLLVPWPMGYRVLPFCWVSACCDCSGALARVVQQDHSSWTIQKMESASFFIISGTGYQSAWHYVPEDLWSDTGGR
jgi:hypothetical protein